MKNIISIVGGMGNQMFQYAFSLSLDNGGQNELNDFLARNGKSNYGTALSTFSGVKMTDRLIMNWLVWFVRKCIVFYDIERFSKMAVFVLNLFRYVKIGIVTDYEVSLKIKPANNPVLQVYYGRFQSEDFFKHNREVVKQALSFNLSKISDKTKAVAEKIVCGNSISVHVRRGDYLDPKNKALFGNISTPEYYKKAIRQILEHVENPVFYVFSDDIPWVKENLGLQNAIFIDWNLGVKSWEDMYLMSLCKHNIIANSTFSWWGAWLNQNPDKMVLCPPKYINSDDSANFFPDAWHKIVI
jgi:hypothetical protein